MIQHPSESLVLLQKLVVQLQREISYADADRDAVNRLARDVEYLAGQLIEWAKD